MLCTQSHTKLQLVVDKALNPIGTLGARCDVPPKPEVKPLDSRHLGHTILILTSTPLEHFDTFLLSITIQIAPTLSSFRP